MKTTKNDQKSGNLKPGQKFFTTVVALAFISFPVVAQDFNNHAVENGQFTILAMETTVYHSDETRSSQTEFNSEAEFSLQIAGLMNVTDYHPNQFAEEEMASEIEMWMNSSSETEETNFYLQIKSLMDCNEYHAAEFVEAEIALETEKWMSSVKF